ERPALRARDRRQAAEVDVGEEVADGDVRELQLRLARARREHPQPGRGRLGQAGLPERRLADAGLAGQEERTPGAFEQELAQRLQLGLAADDRAQALLRP